MRHGRKSPTKRTSSATCVCRTRKGKYYKQQPSVRFTWKAMKEGTGRALEIFSLIKISLAIVSHLECAELTKFQEFLKMVLRSKAQKESIIRSKRGKTVQESPSSTTSPGVEVRKKRARSAAWNLFYAIFFYQLSSCLQYKCRQRKDKSSMMLT